MIRTRKKNLSRNREAATAVQLETRGEDQEVRESSRPLERFLAFRALLRARTPRRGGYRIRRRYWQR